MNDSRPHEVLSVPVASAAVVVAAAAPRVSASRLCEDAGLDRALLAEPRARIPMHRLATLYESAARRTGDRAFGLRVGEALDIRHFGLFGYILLHSATLDLALERAARYLPLWTEGARFRHERDGGWVRVTWEYADPDATAICQDSEMSVATVAATCRRLAGGADIGLAEAWFRHDAPRDRGEHARVFGASVRFDRPFTALLFRGAALARRAPAADARLCEVLMHCADAEIDAARSRRSAGAALSAALPGAGTAAERARGWLRANLESGSPRLEHLAREFGMSPRALQRELSLCGATYAKLLAAVRREIAEDCLRDPRMPLAEISWRLGFGQPNEFHRAFREWTGITPGQYRKRRAD